MSNTNETQLKVLRAEILRVGKVIEEQEREAELKSLACQLREGDLTIELLMPEVMELDPERNERLCEYYISLFSEFERLKRRELLARNAGRDAHHSWLHASYQSDTDTLRATRSMARSIAEKIAVSGITAGLIWLGKTIVENWPFGYNYSDDVNLNSGESG